jgi:hypothetical protein
MPGILFKKTRMMKAPNRADSRDSACPTVEGNVAARGSRGVNEKLRPAPWEDALPSFSILG